MNETVKNIGTADITSLKCNIHIKSVHTNFAWPNNKPTHMFSFLCFMWQLANVFLVYYHHLPLTQTHTNGKNTEIICCSHQTSLARRTNKI